MPQRLIVAGEACAMLSTWADDREEFLVIVRGSQPLGHTPTHVLTHPPPLKPTSTPTHLHDDVDPISERDGLPSVEA